MQGDGNTRLVELILMSGGEAWIPPEDVEPAIAYFQPDGHKGLYNKLADDSPAISIRGNRAVVTLAPQMLTMPGAVQASLVFNDAQLNRLTTFPFSVSVAANPAAGAQKTEDYIRLQWLEDKLGEWLAKAEDVLRDYAARAERASETAGENAGAAALSEGNAADSARQAAESEENARQSAQEAAQGAQEAAGAARAAGLAADAAGASALAAQESAALASEKEQQASAAMETAQAASADAAENRAAAEKAAQDAAGAARSTAADTEKAIRDGISQELQAIETAVEEAEAAKAEAKQAAEQAVNDRTDAQSAASSAASSAESARDSAERAERAAGYADVLSVYFGWDSEGYFSIFEQEV